MKTFLLSIRDDFRKWYGSLSIEEIMGNPGLVDAIANMERRMNQLLVQVEA